mgnify:CR=1 FL=1
MAYQLIPSILSQGSRILSPIVRNFVKRKRKQMGKAEIIPDKQIGYGGAAGTAGTEGTKRGLLSSIFDKRNRGLLGVTGAGSLASLAVAFSGDPETPEATPPSDNRDVVLPSPEKDIDPRLLQVLFPNIGGKATNKELINAAILRASLEMLKPRATNENFASSAQRAIKAGATVGSQNIGIYPSARAARQAGESEGFDEIEVYQKDTGWAYKGTSLGFSTSDGGTETSTLPMVETAEDLAKLAPGDSYKFVDENGVTRTAKVPLEGE